MTNPTMFEDPRTLTEARAIFLYQNVPPAVGNLSAQVYAVQLRAALSDRLSVIATKDGFIVSQNPNIQDGWADVMIGLKYNLLTNYSTRRLLTAGVAYEAPCGSPVARQGSPRAIDAQRIDGQWHAFLTGGTPIGYNGHYIGAFGVRAPSNNAVQTSMWYWSNHFDKQLGTSSLYGLFEVNWYHWYDNGSVNVAPWDTLNGGDLFNLGGDSVAPSDIVTGAIGMKYKPHAGLEVGFAYELPFTARRGLMDDRITVDAIFRY